MASRKYAGDYRLDNVERGGKLKTVAVYQGERYRFADADALSAAKPRLIVFAAVFWLAMLIALLLRTGCAHTIYVIMPMVFAMLPFFLACRAIYAAVTASEEFTREQSDKLQSRLAGGSLIAAVLSGASFAGCLIYFYTARESETLPSADIFFSLCALLQTAAAIMCFRQRGALLTVPAGAAPRIKKAARAVQTEEAEDYDEYEYDEESGEYDGEEDTGDHDESEYDEDEESGEYDDSDYDGDDEPGDYDDSDYDGDDESGDYDDSEYDGDDESGDYDEDEESGEYDGDEDSGDYDDSEYDGDDDSEGYDDPDYDEDEESGDYDDSDYDGDDDDE